MNIRLIAIALIAFVILVTVGCSKSANYSTADHTIGVGKLRHWTGYSNGYFRGDTLWGTVHVAWPVWFAYNTSDTQFAIIPINGFAVNVLGNIFNWRSTDSLNKMVRFDTTYANAAQSILIWNYGVDTMHLELHTTSGWNDTAHKYYQINKFLHGNPS